MLFSNRSHRNDQLIFTARIDGDTSSYGYVFNDLVRFPEDSLVTTKSSGFSVRRMATKVQPLLASTQTVCVKY